MKKQMISKVKEQYRAIDAALKELKRAEKKFPEWPIDMIHRAAIVAEESGELIQAALDFEAGTGSIIHVREEAIQVAAMALRVLISIEKFEGVLSYEEKTKTTL